MSARISHKGTLQHTGLLLGVGVACWALLRWPVAAANGVSRGLAVRNTRVPRIGNPPEVSLITLIPKE